MAKARLAEDHPRSILRQPFTASGNGGRVGIQPEQPAIGCGGGQDGGGMACTAERAVDGRCAGHQRQATQRLLQEHGDMAGRAVHGAAGYMRTPSSRSLARSSCCCRYSSTSRP